jgi:hypothetical protein
MESLRVGFRKETKLALYPAIHVPEFAKQEEE